MTNEHKTAVEEDVVGRDDGAEDAHELVDLGHRAVVAPRIEDAFHYAQLVGISSYILCFFVVVWRVFTKCVRNEHDK